MRSVKLSHQLGRGRVGTARLFSSKARDYNDMYLEHTVIPTFHFQDSLPKLPVPKIEDTMRRYKYFTEPLVSAEAHAETCKLADAFASGEGKKLNEILVARDKAVYSNYVSGPWNDMYVKSRDGLMINSNPQLTFLDNPNQTGWVERASSLICSSVRFYKTLKDKKLSPDIFHTKPKDSQTDRFNNLMRMIPRQVAFYGSYWYGAFPLDMSQYSKLFSSTRIPKVGEDELVTYEPSESRHVIVQYGSQFFKVDAIAADGSPLPYEQVEAQIKGIVSRPIEAGPALGALTAVNRDTWANARAELAGTSAGNEASLKTIDSALFAVCLEEESPVEYGDLMSCMLHGKGTNRWFDKSFQLIVTKNGKASINFEHAWGDGVAVLRYFNEIYKDNENFPIVPSSTTASVAPLEFDFSPSVVKSIEEAQKTATDLIKSIELSTSESDAVGRSFLKSKGIGADGFLQMAFQLGHQKMHGHTVSTYESANASHYKHGRTETIRSATPEAAEFAKVFCEQGVSKEKKTEIMLKAIKQHGKITKDAMTGNGMDRHLFVLSKIAEEENLSPGIFQDETYSILNKIILSTSTLSSPALFTGGFGPVNQDCYGIGYDIKDSGFRVGVTSYHKGSKELVDNILAASKEMLECID